MCWCVINKLLTHWLSGQQVKTGCEWRQNLAAWLRSCCSSWLNSRISWFRNRFCSSYALHWSWSTQQHIASMPRQQVLHGNCTVCDAIFISWMVNWPCWLGNRKGTWPINNLCHLSPKVIYQKRWGRKTNGDQQPTFTRKMAVKTQLEWCISWLSPFTSTVFHPEFCQ